MDQTRIILLKEYDNLEFVYGKYFMAMMFRGFSGYIEVRDENTFYEVRDGLSELTLR
jgi:hypothetical protein